jgi:hypothetical protein
VSMPLRLYNLRDVEGQDQLTGFSQLKIRWDSLTIIQFFTENHLHSSLLRISYYNMYIHKMNIVQPQLPSNIDVSAWIIGGTYMGHFGGP